MQTVLNTRESEQLLSIITENKTGELVDFIRQIAFSPIPIVFRFSKNFHSSTPLELCFLNYRMDVFCLLLNAHNTGLINGLEIKEISTIFMALSKRLIIACNEKDEERKFRMVHDLDQFIYSCLGLPVDDMESLLHGGTQLLVDIAYISNTYLAWETKRKWLKACLGCPHINRNKPLLRSKLNFAMTVISDHFTNKMEILNMLFDDPSVKWDFHMPDGLCAIHYAIIIGDIQVLDLFWRKHKLDHFTLFKLKNHFKTSQHDEMITRFKCTLELLAVAGKTEILDKIIKYYKATASALIREDTIELAPYIKDLSDRKEREAVVRRLNSSERFRTYRAADLLCLLTFLMEGWLVIKENLPITSNQVRFFSIIQKLPNELTTFTCMIVYDAATVKSQLLKTLVCVDAFKFRLVEEKLYFSEK
jgi:hypothetical protein